MAYLAFVFCCVVWGSTFILLERVTHVLGPVEVAAWRMFSGSAIVSACWWFGKGSYRLSLRDILILVFVALVFTSPPQVIQAFVLHQGFGHSFFGTIVAAVPLLTILVSVPMLRIWPTQRELVGVLGGLASLWFLVDDGIDRGISVALLTLAFMIPVSSAISNTIIKWKLPHVPAAPLTAVLLLVAGIALLPLQLSPIAMTALHIGPDTNGAAMTATTFFYLALLGVVGSGVSTMAFVWMILKKGPLFAGMATYVVPVLALLWGLADGEMITVRQLLAIGGVLAMVALVQLGTRRPAILEIAIEEAISPVPLNMVNPLTPVANPAEFATSGGRTAERKSQVA